MKVKPALVVRKGETLSLSGPALTELLGAVLERGKAFRFRAKGMSMAPFIRDGDVVTVAPLGTRKPRTGEVTAFLHPLTGKAVVHRIVRRSSGFTFLKGDNAFDVDGPLPERNILGTVSRVERNGRPIRRGTGPGSLAIALLSRSGYLIPGLASLRRFVRKGPKRIS